MNTTAKYAKTRRRLIPTALVSLLVSYSFANAEQVGNVDVDWLGND
ncbi:hypothetical protein BCF46_3920 [Litoreibacter meonggei]|uniref:Uncharacterized protein n=1 Tax=Litoreibacter meonggei TaxID=1049199 RepID=A0A497V1S6_9RHOB|nr:hypothetical protein BCF46_3920 [Litoreibacter meonggei]